MKQLYLRMMMLALLIGSVSSWAYDVVSESDTLRTDSISEPEWYVAPVIPASLRAPMRTSTAAASCKTDSVLTFNVDSVLTDVTVYEYDEASRTVGTLVWTCNTDGSRVGKSRTEDRYDASGTKTMTATYVWDNMTNDWKGNAKTEYTFENGKNTVTITFDWLNGDWSAKTRYNYAYDAAGREIEYIYYTRNAASMQLVPAKSRIREYNAAGKMTLEIQYTAHDGTGWYAGTKKEYDYDAAGNQTEYTYYGSLSNSNWIGSTHEVWTYNAANQKTYYEKQTWSNVSWANDTKEIWDFNTAGKQTLHEKYNGSNTDWTLALQEKLGYDEAGNNTLVENYSLTNNVWKGTKKEEYTYVGTNKTGTITYNWNADNNAFVYKTWSINNTAENPNEKCSYNWVNDAWVGTGTRKLTTKTGGKTTEVITQTWPSGSIVWVNKTCTTTIYVGDNKTQETYYDWSNDTWVGKKRTDYTFNADGINIMTHNAKWQNNAWVMTSMTRTDISDETIDGVHQISYTQWQCGADSVWKGVQKDTTSYYITAENTQNPLYSASFSSMVNNDWVPSYIIEHEYDAADREILNRRMDWVNNKWQGHYLYEYEYDDQGQQTSYTYYGDWNSSTNSWIGGSKYDYVYATNGQYAQKIMYKWQYDDNQWVGLFQYFYRYDAANHEIEQLVQNYSNDDWRNSQLYVREYKGNELIKNNEFRWVNDQWQFTRRNEKIYDEDTQMKLRREIEGAWNTNGVLISYTDKHYVYPCDPRTIRFVNYDGTLLETQTLDKGVTPSYSGAEPTRESNAEYTYAFSGWSPEIVPVTGDATYTATFTATKNSYTITWKNDDGSIIESETLTYGAMPAHTDINKENTAEWTYTFAGWEPEIVAVVGDASYTAKFDSTKNTYTITFYSGYGTILEQMTVEYGQIPVCRYTPSLISDDFHHYDIFTGWTPEIVPATCDASYTPTFELVTRQYTITFRNYNGKELQSSKVDYGTMPEYTGETPERIGSYPYSYIFTGWDPELVPVSGDAVYKAIFEKVMNTYHIVFYDEDGITELDQKEVEYGKVPSTSVVPTKEDDEEYTYTFAGWSPQLKRVTGDATYTATYKPTAKTEGINNAEAGETATKVIIDNQIFIRRGGNIYTIDGQRVK